MPTTNPNPNSMNQIDFNGIDSPHAIHGASRLARAIEQRHSRVLEHIESLATNPGTRSGMRAIYSVRLEALVKALNDLAHCQREFEARVMDAMESAYGAEAECAIEYLLMPPPPRQRFPQDDEQ